MVGVLASCAVDAASGARFWTLESCTAIPRQSCEVAISAVRRIEAASGFSLSRVLIADTGNPNAFATRDRNASPIVVVTTGMVGAIGADEDAWAGLIGHEIAHLVRRHAEGRNAAQASARGAGSLIANLISHAVPGVGGAIGGTIAGSATQMAVYGSYTRPQEAEADRFGLEWMVAAGYDPHGLLRLFETLGRRDSMPAFLSTHPPSQERANAVAAFIAHRPPKPAPVAPASSCEEATAEVRLRTACSAGSSCWEQIAAIRGACVRASHTPCLAAQDGLPTYCSGAYGEKLCASAAAQVAIHCRDL